MKDGEERWCGGVVVSVVVSVMVMGQNLGQRKRPSAKPRLRGLSLASSTGEMLPKPAKLSIGINDTQISRTTLYAHPNWKCAIYVLSSLSFFWYCCDRYLNLGCAAGRKGT